MKTESIRDAYGEELAKLGEENHRLVVLEADVGSSTKSAMFGKQFPERYFNMGISELNMVNTAAGLAAEGLIPFVNTFAVFLASRASDPVQSLIAYDRLNVKLAGAYSGLSDSYDGASHHSITDLAFMRALPGMLVVSVCDGEETRKAVAALAEYEGPAYLRLSRAESPQIFGPDYEFCLGKGVVLEQGNDVTIFSTGTMAARCMEAAGLLRSQGISAAVIHIHTVKPLDEELIVHWAKQTGSAVTVEEHSIWGGFGGAIAEVLGKRCPVPIEIIGLDRFAESGALSACWQVPL